MFLDIKIGIMVIYVIMTLKFCTQMTLSKLGDLVRHILESGCHSVLFNLSNNFLSRRWMHI